jgi:hypothetical protein
MHVIIEPTLLNSSMIFVSGCQDSRLIKTISGMKGKEVPMELKEYLKSRSSISKLHAKEKLAIECCVGY